ncbi:hypothetical protein BGZ46_003356 [Entomortierella lignicola]|nr:hypothetical protein BGZ46_003356 [Entomortierella lignicola]
MKFNQLVVLSLVVLNILTANALPAGPKSSSPSSTSTLPSHSSVKKLPLLKPSSSSSSPNSHSDKKTKTKTSEKLSKKHHDPNQPKILPKPPALPSTNQSQTLGSKPNPPLLLLPNSNSVWHAGSTQTVKWSKKYAKRLSKNTTVDIILVDSRTNKKIRSLKRFIPFRKGNAKVWVPSKLPEDASYMLVLELYDGRSQRPATVKAKVLGYPTLSDIPTSTATTPTSQTTETPSSIASDSKHGKSIPSILRRSDISITHRVRRAAQQTVESSQTTSVAHDMNDDDYYKGHKETKPLEFAPDEFRQEYPNIIQPIELQHNFGLYQKVYTMAPYTLEWKIPARVSELMEYTQKRLRLMMDKTIDKETHHMLNNNKEIFLAKIQVELVQHQTLEPISVLARNVPVETKFQYLQIHEHVLPAYYRLKVHMVVVAVQGDHESGVLNHSDSTESKLRTIHGDYMEGWDFPSGGRVIDRYESITRKFWVSEGAL